MIYEHEIPQGSRLYFGKDVANKRTLESNISNYLIDLGFEEILTPNFSYSQHQSVTDVKKLINISDKENNQITLRADSTLDIIRVVTRRLGQTTSHKKWFYVQPIFTYPSTEHYQIGVEWLDYDNVANVIDVLSGALKFIGTKSIVQISNINIPKIISDEFGIDFDLFKNSDIDKLFKLNIDWLDALLRVVSVDDLKVAITIAPKSIKNEIQNILDICMEIKYDNLAISPLYCSQLSYYEGICFKVVQDNYVIAKGGSYYHKEKNSKNKSLGFALYTDNILKIVEGLI